jgi:DNA replication and repair protein RecF
LGRIERKVQIRQLSLARFRCFERAELRPGPGLNLITGDNGAGKTSLLEAAHLVANGRSFRGRVRDGLVRAGEPDLEVFTEWIQADGRTRRAGLRHSGRDWIARLDGQLVAALADLCAALAVLSFEPGSHDLIAGGSEQRRRFIDWALFHVEPEFLLQSRRYARALKQRNALLKSRPLREALAPWTRELEETGEAVTRMRSLYVQQLQPLLADLARTLVPELGVLELNYQPGWKREEYSLAEALRLSIERDLLLGHTGPGPHRADWRVAFERLPGREALSRGQEKLVALACTLAQAHAYAKQRAEWPVFVLDDLASELDRNHQHLVFGLLQDVGAQVLLTGTEIPPVLAGHSDILHRFHVEQGQVRALL